MLSSITSPSNPENTNLKYSPLIKCLQSVLKLRLDTFSIKSSKKLFRTIRLLSISTSISTMLNSLHSFYSIVTMKTHHFCKNPQNLSTQSLKDKKNQKFIIIPEYPLSIQPSKMIEKNMTCSIKNKF